MPKARNHPGDWRGPKRPFGNSRPQAEITSLGAVHLISSWLHRLKGCRLRNSRGDSASLFQQSLVKVRVIQDEGFIDL